MHHALGRRLVGKHNPEEPFRKGKALKSVHGGDVLRREAVNPRDMTVPSFCLQQRKLGKPMVYVL